MRRRKAIGAAVRSGAGIGAVVFALALSACGDDDSEQAATDYEVSADATFPEEQKLAQTSQLRIEVANEDDRTIPDVGVIVDGFSYELTDPNDPKQPDPAVADPSRPQFVVDRSPIEFFAEEESEDASLVDREVAVPYGRGTAYAGTYTLGELAPGDTALFRWDVTAVKAGPYEIAWEVTGDTEPGHNAVDEVGEPVGGTFEGKVSDAPVDARVAKDGKTVVREGDGGSGGGGGGSDRY